MRISLLSFALAYLRAFETEVTERSVEGVITPSDVIISISSRPDRLKTVDGVQFVASRHLVGVSLYEPPSWTTDENRWRFQLGYLLRFILSARQDFTKFVRPTYWKEGLSIYRMPQSQYQRFYGLFNGHAAFGDDWWPISDWTENLLFGLLRWPGCPVGDEARNIVGTIEQTRVKIEGRIDVLQRMQGTSVSLVPLSLPRAYAKQRESPMRACIVQTVIPGEKKDFDPADLTLSKPATRIWHRRHLSAALAAVGRCLALRETHRGRDGRLDLLIFPELAVHPDDVKTHLVPFARAHRATILAGLTYEALAPGELLVNSALWIMPTQDAGRGLQILTRRQGKANLAPSELPFNQPVPMIKPFRPCQWLIGYQWSTSPATDPLWMTAAICYDATDIRLAADLKNYSDLFVVPALNRDVPTFDQMALALHYHMFQMVIVANNGLYGGSNAYAPYSHSWERQIFHMHGQPQASIAFLEIDNIARFKDRKSLSAPDAANGFTYAFKPPPAGD